MSSASARVPARPFGSGVRRFEGLSSRKAACLRYIAAAGREVHLGEIAAALGRSEHAICHALVELRQEGRVEMRIGSHPDVRGPGALLYRIPESSRSALALPVITRGDDQVAGQGRGPAEAPAPTMTGVLAIVEPSSTPSGGLLARAMATPSAVAISRPRVEKETPPARTHAEWSVHPASWKWSPTAMDGTAVPVKVLPPRSRRPAPEPSAPAEMSRLALTEQVYEVVANSRTPLLAAEIAALLPECPVSSISATVSKLVAGRRLDAVVMPRQGGS